MLWNQLPEFVKDYRAHPVVQYVVRILWMVPIYATNSWFGLRFKHISLYVDVLREGYEAFVIYRCAGDPR